jgi:parvulin-like peptidyl-prolyl isomerase
MPATLAGAPGPNKLPPQRNADPLLGPDPDLMPAMPELPAVGSSKKQGSSPAGTSLELVPAVAPASGPTPELNPAEPPPAGPGVMVTPVPADPPIGLDSSSSAAKPSPGGLAAADLPLERAPRSGLVLPAVPARATAPSPAARSGDPHVILTSSKEPKAPPSKRTASMKEAGRAVARVGDEIITQHEFKAALMELISKYPELRDGRMDGASQLERTQVLDHLARQSLAGLIDRSLLVQDAKRHIKDKKMLETVNQEADKVFHEQEVLPLQRKFNVDSEAKVKEKLAEQGRSLEAMRLSFRQVFLAQSYMYQKIKDRTKVELPDLLKYYNEHVYLHEFDRPAQITWRELVVEIGKHQSREAAQKKANALLEKVRRGDDFAMLARTESDGPTSSRKEGGLMQTTPGSYALKPINDTLDSLPIGQVSGVIEGPDSFHILKVEKRRPAGPASFEDVQDKIKPMLESQKMNVEQDAFLKKIKQNAAVSIFLEKSDPNKP